MRIPSGVTDQYLYFVALDATDLKTRETGLSSFTVYRSRNGGAAAAYTTPTINETDSSNMPGVYELLLDEDMTLDAGDQSQEVVLHITHAGMAPVTRTFELYRPSVTPGETLTVSSGTGNAAIQSVANNAITAASIAADVTTELQSGLATAAALATVDTVVDAIQAKTDNLPSDPADASVVAGLISTVEGKIDTIDTNVDAILVDTGTTLQAELDGIQADTEDIQAKIGTPAGASIAADIAAIDAGGGATAEEIAEAVWEEPIGDHSGVSGSTAEALNAAGASGDPWATQLPGAYGSGSAGKIIGDNINATISSRASQSSVDDLPTNAELATSQAASDDATLAAIAALNNLSAAQVNAEVDSALSDYDGPTRAELTSDKDEIITQVNTNETKIDALSIPTANENADALLDRASAIETNWTVRKVLRVLFSALGGKLSGAATSTVTVRDIPDTKARITATVDEDGNRTAVTLDGD